MTKPSLLKKHPALIIIAAMATLAMILLIGNETDAFEHYDTCAPHIENKARWRSYTSRLGVSFSYPPGAHAYEIADQNAVTLDNIRLSARDNVSDTLILTRIELTPAQLGDYLAQSNIQPNSWERSPHSTNWQLGFSRHVKAAPGNRPDIFFILNAPGLNPEEYDLPTADVIARLKPLYNNHPLRLWRIEVTNTIPSSWGKTDPHCELITPVDDVLFSLTFPPKP